jgi:hypothetical protein
VGDLARPLVIRHERLASLEREREGRQLALSHSHSLALDFRQLQIDDLDWEHRNLPRLNLKAEPSPQLDGVVIILPTWLYEALVTNELRYEE